MANDLLQLLGVAGLVGVAPHGVEQPIEVLGEYELGRATRRRPSGCCCRRLVLVGYHLHVLLELLGDEEVGEWRRVEQTLQDAVHEARVAVVAQAHVVGQQLAQLLREQLVLVVQVAVVVRHMLLLLLL